MVTKKINIRLASQKDCGLILDFIKELALYEKRLESVKATMDDVRDIIFKKNIGQAIIAEYEGNAAGFALFFYNISTFEGRCGIYIEDMFVKEDMRNRGIGKKMFSFLAKYAIENGCSRIEWTVLKWNKPSIDFYKGLGAEPKEEWDIYKISGKALERLSWK